MAMRFFARIWLTLSPEARVLFRAAILIVPALLLLVASLRVTGEPALMLWIGTGFQLVCCFLSFVTSSGRRQPLGPAVVTLYVIALGWLWLGKTSENDWFIHLARAVLLVVPLMVFGHQLLADSGATALRRAQILARHLAKRRDWPPDLNACRMLPEVKALRESLHVDATPALALLTHPRPEVRVAALAALEFRQNWKPGQVDIILQMARHATEPPIRAAALSALANVDEREMVEALADFLIDKSPLVRQAAIEAILWDSDRRWPWIGHAVRRSLADPICRDDGALRNQGPLLPPQAVADLTAWAAEKGVVSVRAALTLGAHYDRALGELGEEHLTHSLRRQLGDSHTPPALRMELMRILQQHRELDEKLLKKLIDPANPAPVRLAAVEELLAEGDNFEAVVALHDLARLPNREIALATADVVQRRLGVDLGLALGEPLPPVQSRQAAEVTRRVMVWATQNNEPEEQSAAAERVPKALPTG